MRTRIISGCLIAPFLVVVLLGGVFIKAAVFIISVMGIYEFYKGFQKMKVHPSFLISLCSAIGLFVINIAVFVLKLFPEGITVYLYSMWLFLSVLASLLSLFRLEKRSLADGMATITGIVYLVFLFVYIIKWAAKIRISVE